EKIDVSRLTVQFNNAKVERQKAERAIQLTFYLLKYQMGMPVHQLIYLEDDLKNITINFEEAALSNFQYSDRIEYSQLQTYMALSELDLKNTKVQYLPKINVFVNIGASMGTNTSDDLFDFKNSWFENGAFEATLSLPVFDGLRKSYTIQQNRLAIQKLNNNFSLLRNSIDLSITQSKISLENNMETLESYRENMDLAKEVSEIAKIKYQE